MQKLLSRGHLWALAFVSVSLLFAQACADKNMPGSANTQNGGSAPPAGADTTRRDSLAHDTAAVGMGVTPALTPATATVGAGPAGPPVAVRASGKVATSSGEVVKRSHRDSVALASMTKPDSVLDPRWPVKMAAPLAGALLPANRIVAFYGNPLEKRMGVLGEYPKDQMLAMLDREVKRWADADPDHPVIPALHMVVTTAQGAPGKNGLYRLRMKDSLVDAIYGWAKARHAVYFVDVQLGKDNVRNEIPRLRPWLENPDVHLAIDPEFAMATSGRVPGTKIGTLDASDINWCVDFLNEIATSKNLPPKILIVHRFTRPMVTNAKSIKFTPHVQVVMDMDGWGPPWLKFDSYHDYVKAEPVQFTGFKLFYHNDTKTGTSLLTPAEVLRLNPKPLYIQYQ